MCFTNSLLYLAVEMISSCKTNLLTMGLIDTVNSSESMLFATKMFSDWCLSLSFLDKLSEQRCSISELSSELHLKYSFSTL